MQLNLESIAMYNRSHIIFTVLVFIGICRFHRLSALLYLGMFD